MMSHPCHPPVVPPQYPYGTSAHDSYTFCVCGKIPQGVPPFPEYPVNGPFKGNGFATKDTFPYLIDTTYTSYGQIVCFSESVYTKITQRQDPSCINLAATFNMTDTTLTNTVRTDFLQKYIARKYGVLNGVLPIIKTGIKFKIYYSITDIDGGLLHKGIAVSTVIDNHFHFTDIRDLFVQSARGVIIENIPAVTYAGLYNITIDRVEAYVNVINTYDHLQDSLNPYYSFRDNNMKIVLNHSIIEQETPDEEILIAECDVNKTFEYRANVTNRLRMSFVAFTNIPIAVGSTVGIYEALNEPTEEIITQLRNEVSACQDEIKHLHEIIEQQNILIQNISNQTELNKNNIASLLNRVSLLEQNGESYDARLDNHELRITKLEAVPLATVLYKRDVHFVKGQITWETHGELYQVAKDFVASGNFNNEIIAGNIVPCVVGDVDVAGVMARIDAIEDNVNTAVENANAAAATVDTLTEEYTPILTTVGEHTTQIGEINTSLTSVEGNVSALSDRVSTLSDTVDGHTTSIGTNTENISTNTANIATNTANIATNASAIADHESRITALES